ncbi:hypothetical protein K431DRAFT_37026 [Polychaeton citri CBS 116435]|uniref:Fucose-specific lectin n=1 Tax=Polychaeton citri CBS 116435 TaxID=1314669 RepID=A0A9P4QDM0_9PEZI|nr:hypothetical protein K431DRAFT_37026 [Polychaeton citri CBS 116435]
MSLRLRQTTTMPTSPQSARSPRSPQQAGLEAVNPDRTPEKEHYDSYPEVVEQSSTPEAVMQQRRSYEGLEPVHPEHGQFLDSRAPHHLSRNSDNSYISAFYEGSEIQPDKSLFYPSSSKVQRRICGMRRRTFFIIVGLVVALVIVGAVVGGVLGALLPNKKSSHANSPAGPNNTDGTSIVNLNRAAIQKSGLTLLTGVGGSNYILYQREGGNGAVVAYPLGKTDASEIQVTTSAAPGSPIAGVSYNMNGTATWQIFFVDNTQNVMTTYSRDSSLRSWSTPSSILSGLQAPLSAPASGVVGLAACADNSTDGGLNGIRVYYGTQNNNVQEIGKDFSGSATNWNFWYTFDGASDAYSGLGCVASATSSHLYMRNTSSNALVQWQFNYGTAGPWSQVFRYSVSDMPEGTNIAVTTDGASTDYVYYQQVNGSVFQAVSGTASSTPAKVFPQSKLAAWYGKGAAFTSGAQEQASIGPSIILQTDQNSTSIEAWFAG